MVAIMQTYLSKNQPEYLEVGMKCLNERCGLFANCPKKLSAEQCPIFNSWLLLHFEMDGAASLLALNNSLTSVEKQDIISYITGITEGDNERNQSN